MDLRDPKNQIFLVIIFAFLVLIYIWHARFYTPYSEELSVKKTEYEKLRSDLFSVRQKAMTLDALNAELEQKRLEYEKIKLLLPEIKEDETFLAQLHIAAQLTNSTVMSITPQALITRGFYNENPYIVELESTYHNLGNFFAKIVNFPFIVNISNLQIKAKEKKQSMMQGEAERRKDLTVSVTFRLTSYNSHKGGQTQ